MKSGLFVLLPIDGPAGDEVAAIQREFDPKLAALGPPHLTLAGSSGIGPIAPDTSMDLVRKVLDPIARETPAMRLDLQPPHRFMQSKVVVLPIDPYGPVRALHERLKAARLPAAHPRFAFTPHVTLNFYRELSPERLRELLARRVDAVAEVARMQLYHTWEQNVKTELLWEWTLQG